MENLYKKNSSTSAARGFGSYYPTIWYETYQGSVSPPWASYHNKDNDPTS